MIMLRSLLALYFCILNSLECQSYYMGEGIGFEMPENWLIIDGANDQSTSILQSLGLSLPAQLTDRITAGRSKLFIVNGLTLNRLNLDIYEASSTYSRVLQDYLEDSIRENLEKKGFTISGPPIFERYSVAGIPSPYYKFSCSLHSQSFIFTGLLIPCYDRFLYFHILLPKDQQIEFERQFHSFLGTFYGSGLVVLEFGFGSFFLQAFFIAFLIVYFKNRSQRG